MRLKQQQLLSIGVTLLVLERAYYYFVSARSHKKSIELQMQTMRESTDRYFTLLGEKVEIEKELTGYKFAFKSSVLQELVSKFHDVLDQVGSGSIDSFGAKEQMLELYDGAQETCQIYGLDDLLSEIDEIYASALSDLGV